jgi:hypothetical protein
MFILYAVVFGIIFGYIAGGSLKNMALRPLYWKSLALLAFVIQFVIFSNLSFVKTLPAIIIVVMHYFSYICLLVFIIRNIKNRGVNVVGIGIFLNSLVIFLNGGHMPTIPQNLKNTSVGQSAEVINQGIAVQNSVKLTNETLLPWLGDIFYLPSWVPLSNVFSVGDIMIAIGICIYIGINMHSLKISRTENKLH